MILLIITIALILNNVQSIFGIKISLELKNILWGGYHSPHLHFTSIFILTWMNLQHCSCFISHDRGNIECRVVYYLHIASISYVENYLLIEDPEKLITKCCYYSARKSDLISNLLFSSVQFNCSVASDCLWPHESQHARPPCPSPIPRVHSNSHPSSQWCHPAISSSVVPFSSCPQSLPASGSFPVSQLFAWGGQSIGVSALASVLPMNAQEWSPLE